VAWAERLWETGGRCVLDLGCGIGRHAVALAHLGFAVTATDVSPSGLATCAAWLAARLGSPKSREGLSAKLVRHEMEVLPFPDRIFDGLIAYNVIYHTTLPGMRRVLSEMHRVLRPDSRLYVTANARDESRIAGFRADVEAGKCREIEPFTFIYLRDAPGDEHLPHHYCNEARSDVCRPLRLLLADFVVDDLRLVRQEYADDDGMVQIGVHYHVQARRP